MTLFSYFHSFFIDTSPPPRYPFPYTTLFRSRSFGARARSQTRHGAGWNTVRMSHGAILRITLTLLGFGAPRSEEHTSELQSQSNLVCRLLLEKKKSHTSVPCTSRRSWARPSD